MHNWAAKGAAYADCVGRASNDAFWKFVSKTYETQADITAENADEKLTALADGAGVKGAEIAACAAKPETKAHVDASIALGKAVDVTGTPTLFINGRKVGSFDASHVGCLQEPGGVRGEASKVGRSRTSLSLLCFRINKLGCGSAGDPGREPGPHSYFSLIQISGVARSKFDSTCGVMMIISSSLSDCLVLFTIA